MECFTHISAPAVGFCKICGKAVCRQCALSDTLQITCSTACAKEAADLHEMNQRAKKLYGIGVPKKVPSSVIMWALFALLFGGFGIYQTIKHQQPDWFLILFGAASAFIGLLAYLRGKDSGLQY